MQKRKDLDPGDRLWDFHCTCEVIEAEGKRFRVTVRTASGLEIVRESVNPIWELIRIVGGKGSNSKEEHSACG